MHMTADANYGEQGSHGNMLLFVETWPRTVANYQVGGRIASVVATSSQRESHEHKILPSLSSLMAMPRYIPSCLVPFRPVPLPTPPSLVIFSLYAEWDASATYAV